MNRIAAADVSVVMADLRMRWESISIALGVAVTLFAGCGGSSPDDAASSVVDHLSGERVSYVSCGQAHDDGTVTCWAKVSGRARQFVVSRSGDLEEVQAPTVEDVHRKPHKDNPPPSERCRSSNLGACDPTSACLIKFGVNPDDWEQPPGWIACLKDRGATREIIRQYRR